MSNDLLQPTFQATGRQRMPSLSAKTLQWSSRLLTTTVWVSACLFGLYILAFYAAALYEGNMERWNNVLPRLYESSTTAATTGIGLHFAMGGIILVFGSIQLIDSVRVRFPALHRWIGRVYVVACLLAAVGGLLFIAVKGTIGGPVMNVGFAGYGVLMFISAIATYRSARLGNLRQHRLWALRLYALAIGSWLYRMDYGFWFALTNAVGHTPTFSGPFDQIMAFFFYIPNLIVVEALVRAGDYNLSPVLRWSASFVFLFATVFLMLGTYYFTLHYWGPAIVSWITGA